jgi:hypothetical protein
VNLTVANHLSKYQKIIVGLFLILKLVVLILLPLTGDEAYFITWGQDVSMGYYDHPPVIGWLIYLLSFISEHYYFYRLFAFLTSIFAAYLLYRLICPIKGVEVALLASLVFLLSPLSLFSIILVNDVALLLFGLLGFYCFSRTLEKDSYLGAILSGVFFGLCFLSKYLSAPMFIGILLYLIANRSRVNWKLVIVGGVVASLFVVENLVFNLQNCWNNIVFNLFSRTDGEFNLTYTALFLASFAFVVPPQGVFRLLKADRNNIAEVTRQAIYIAVCFFVIFLLVSTFKRIGLHWLFLLATFVYLLFLQLPPARLRALFLYNSILSMTIAVTLIIVLTQADSLFAGNKKYGEALFYTETESVCANLPKNETIYSLSYSKNSVLSYHCADNEFHIFSSTSKYGREDDKKIDFSTKVNETLWILITELDEQVRVEPYFESTKVHTINMSDQLDYYLVEARGFKFEEYKSNVLGTISRRFYSPPDWLPTSSCEFNDKYRL